MKTNLKELLKDILIALAIVLVISVCIKPTIVKGTSMNPTLYENNYLILNKLSYLNNEPNYGDIIVINTERENEKLIIKRVIGIEGDQIDINGGEVYRNGKQLDENYISEKTEGTYHFSVPSGKCFVLGDNRPVSLDSRSDEIGYIDKKNIVGKATLRIFPFNKMCILK